VGGLDYTTWQALGLTLTLLGLVLSAVVWRRKGATAGLRGVAWSLLPLAAALTGTLRLGWEVGDAVVDWAVRLVFSPVVWLGIVLAGVSVVLFVVTGFLRGRSAAAGGQAPARGQVTAERSTAPATAAKRPAAGAGPAADVGLDDDIEAILRRHGIS
jgi:hypothetical protein